MSGQPFTSVRYPPRLGHLRIATAPRTRSAAGLCLYTPSRPRARAAHRLAFRFVSLFGTRLLPDRRTDWSPHALSRETWTEALDSLVDNYGDLALAGVHSRRTDFGFPSVGVLVELAQPLTITSCRSKSDAASAKRRQCRRLFVQIVEAAPAGALPNAETLQTIASRLDTARTPTVVGCQENERWQWFAWEAMPPVPHAPVLENIEAICSDLNRALRPVFGKDDTSADWRPMHGDLTPWNLRSTGDGLPWILDWDDIALAPPGADLAHFWGAAVGIDLVSPEAPAPDAVAGAAIRFWLEDWQGGRPLAPETARGLRAMLARK